MDQKDHIDIIIINFEKSESGSKYDIKIYQSTKKGLKSLLMTKERFSCQTSVTILKSWKPTAEKMHIVVPNARNHLVELNI